MKTRILAGMIIFSLLLASCGKAPQTELQKPETIQNHTSGSTTPQISSVSGSTTEATTKQANSTKAQAAEEPAPFRETCDLLTDNMRDPSMSFDVQLLKDCNLRAAVEAKDFRYCIDNVWIYLDISGDAEEWLRDCARTTMFHAIEKSMEKNGKLYPKDFCKKVYKEILSGWEWTVWEKYREKVSSHVIDDCQSAYALMANAPEMCQNDKIWGEDTRGDWLAYQLQKQNECTWNLHLAHPEKLSAKNACASMRQTGWAWVWSINIRPKEINSDGSCGFGESDNGIVRIVAGYKKLPSAEWFKAKNHEIVKEATEKYNAENKASEEMNGLLR